MMKQITDAAPSFKARIAGALYLITIVGGILALFVHGRLGSVADLIAGLSYMGVTVLLYFIFRPVGRNVSLLAAVLSIAGFIAGRLGLQPRGVEVSMVFFGLYCILIGGLIFRSTFLPRILGVVMAFAGSVWLTVLSPSLAARLNPYNLAAGGIAELSFCLWLLAMGLNDSRWHEQRAIHENHSHKAQRVFFPSPTRYGKI